MADTGVQDRLRADNDTSRKIHIPPDVSTTSAKDSRPLMVLINPNSGRGRSLRTFRKYVTKFFDKHHLNYEVFITTADVRVKDFIARKGTNDLLRYRALVVVSGDGLVFDLVNAIMARSDWQQVMTVPIGLIPTGSGNGLAHTLLGHSQTKLRDQSEFVELCCQQVAQNQTCSSDLVRVTYDGGATTIWSFLSIGWGLLADIDVDSDWLRRLGEFRFTIYGLIRALTSVSRRGRLSFKPVIDDTTPRQNSKQSMNQNMGPEAKISIKEDARLACSDTDTQTKDQDGWVHIEDKFACLYAVHQSHISRTTRFAPKSTLSDGLIYLTYVRGKLSPCKVVEFLTSIDDGSHERLPYVTVAPVREFIFEPKNAAKIVIDGERINWNQVNGPITAKVVPAAMKLIWAYQ